MPKLLTFVPCLKGINGDDGLLTIVSVLEFVRITIPENSDPPPANGMVDLQWQLVSLWYREASDVGKQFEQTIDITLPDGNPFLSGTFPIDLTSNRPKIKIDGRSFPVGVPGDVIIRVGYREVGQQESILQQEYPVLVEHTSPPK